MDPLRADDIARAKQLSPSDKLLLALRMMDEGLKLQRAKFAAKYPQDDEAALDRRMLTWRLERD